MTFSFSSLWGYLTSLFHICESIDSVLIDTLPEGTAKEDLEKIQTVVTTCNNISTKLQAAIDAHPASTTTTTP